MCKRLCAVCALLLTLMITAACTGVVPLSDSEADVYQRIHKKYSQMKSYTARVRMTVQSNKTEEVYELEQQVRVPDAARITVTSPQSLSGLAAIYNGDSVTLRQAGMGEVTLPAVPELNYTRPDEFFALYYQSEDTTVSASGGESGQMLLETAVMPRQSEEYKVTLLLDSKKLTPKVLTLYDVGGNIRMTAEYFDFCYNPALEDAIFQ